MSFLTRIGMLRTSRLSLPGPFEYFVPLQFTLGLGTMRAIRVAKL
jgi:hypothetical protein